MSALDATPYDSPLARDRFNGYLIRQIAVNVGLTCGWKADPPDALTMCQLRVGIGHTTGVDTGTRSFTKDELYALADWFDAPLRERKHRENSRDLRVKLADVADFDYERDRSTATFKKSELKRLLMAAAKRDLEAHR